MWLTMRGALSASVECKYRSYYLPSMTGIATAIYEGTDAPNPTVSSASSGTLQASLPASNASKARIRSRSSAA
jgi:hypothetical protein